MEKNNFYKLLIILLLVLNLGTLSYLFFSAGKPPQSPPPDGQQPPPFAEMLQKELLLTDAQTAQVKDMHTHHLQKMDSLQMQYQQVLQQYFNLLLQQNVLQQKDSLQQILSAITTQRADEAFHHFNAIRQLLNKEQLQKYQEQLPKILQPVLHPQKNLPPPPKD